MLADFKVQVWPCRQTGRTDSRDQLPASDEVSFLDQQYLGMRIACEQAIAVINFDQIAKSPLIRSGAHDSPRSRQNRGAQRGREV